jgi:hypothetical protein
MTKRPAIFLLGKNLAAKFSGKYENFRKKIDSIKGIDAWAQWTSDPPQEREGPGLNPTSILCFKRIIAVLL